MVKVTSSCKPVGLGVSVTACPQLWVETMAQVAAMHARRVAFLRKEEGVVIVG